MPLLNPTSTIVVKGTIEEIKYISDENGYVVLEIKGQDKSWFVTTGIMPDAAVGLEVHLTGDWQTHPVHGNQFKFTSYDIPEPDTPEGLVCFLSTLNGVGEFLARTIVEKFGTDTWHIFEEDSKRLLEVKGIGEKNLPVILESFNERKGLSNLIKFLHRIEVAVSYATPLYKEYGDSAITRIKQNPYILIEEVKGFGFHRADEIARGLDIKPGSDVRIEAGIIHILKTAAFGEGHCFLPEGELKEKALELLMLPNFRPTNDLIEHGIHSLMTKRRKRGLKKEKGVIYLKDLYYAEKRLARKLVALAGFNHRDHFDPEWVNEFEKANKIKLGKDQKRAIVVVARNGLTIIAGGAGTGKSTICKAIVQMWHEQGRRVVALAPTGKAALRIKEVTNVREASTIHRQLGWQGHSFEKNEEDPIEGDGFLIDEASMMDVKLASALFDAIPPHAAVAIVGDFNQLPSVGPGNVLRDMIESEVFPVVQLTEIFRQSTNSRIIETALAVNEGRFPRLETITTESEIIETDALWLRCREAEIPESIKWLITRLLPTMRNKTNKKYTPDQIQCLSAMHSGSCGNIELNKLLKETWNPLSRQREFNGLREGDRVLQTRNNYEKAVFNGDIGKIAEIAEVIEESNDYKEKKKKKKKLVISVVFENINDPTKSRTVEYSPNEALDLTLAYSLTVHKAQGSEFPIVIIPVAMQQYRMLQRNFLYTGITRAKSLLILVSEKKPIEIAVRTNKVEYRNTRLRARIQNNLENWANNPYVQNKFDPYEDEENEENEDNYIFTDEEIDKLDIDLERYPDDENEDDDESNEWKAFRFK